MGGLTDETAFGNFYVVGSTTRVTDFENGAIRDIDVPDTIDDTHRYAKEVAAESQDFLNAMESSKGEFDTSGPNSDSRKANYKMLKSMARTTGGRILVNMCYTKVDGSSKDYNTADKAKESFVALYNAIFDRSGSDVRPVVVRKKITALMSSAILAAPGESTGSLLIGYPL